MNAQATGNSVSKTTIPSAWDAGAASTRALIAGDGYVEIDTVLDVHTIVGLSNGNGDTNPGEIDFALYQNNNDRRLYVWENGAQFGPFGTELQAGQKLRVEIQGGHILYKQGTTVLRDVEKRLVYPLLVDASIYTSSGTVSTAVLHGSLGYVSHWCGGVLLTGDPNGDGRTDQLCHKGAEGTVQVALANGHGFAAATIWTAALIVPELITGDFNSDGRTDVAYVADNNGDFFVSLSTGTSLAAPSFWGNANGIAPNPPHYAFSCQKNPPYFPGVSMGAGDFNGDGVTDVSCRVPGKPEAFIGLSTFANGSWSFSFSIFGQLSCELYESTGAIDFDGDGKDDWYCTGMTNSTLQVFPSTGSSFVYPAFGSLDNNFCSGEYVLGDLNGDGRTDAACANSGKIALSTGRHFAIQPGTFGALCPSGTGVFAADVDADGASEIVCNNANAPANDIEVRKWKAGVLGPAETWKGSWCSASLRAGDFNGDGKTDLVCSALSSPVVAGTGGIRSDLLSVATNGIGGSTQATYTSSVNFANTNNPPPKQVVAALATSDGRDGSSMTVYSYAGGYMDRQERRFLGFHEVTQTLPCIAGDCPVVHTSLKQDLPSAGKPERIERRNGAGQVLKASEYVYSTTVGPPRTSLLTEEWSYTYDLTGAYKRTKATHQYDAYGNRIQTTAHGDADSGGDKVTAAWTFRPNTSAYIVDRVALQQQFAGIGTAGTKLSEHRYSYDNAGTWDTPPTQGFLTRDEGWLDTELRHVARTMGYDSWGNLTSVADETGRPPTTTTYDLDHHVFPTSRTNGENETETATWDPLCTMPTARTDANQQATTYQHDNFCRPHMTSYPLGGFETRTYFHLGDPTAQFVHVATPGAAEGESSGNDYVLEYFDGLGRPYKTIKKGIPTRPTIRRDIAYNARGGIASETTPYYEGYETPRTTSYTVDSLDRVLSTVFPDNNQVQKTYGIWRETKFDEHNHPTTTRFDAHGRKKQTEQILSGQTLATSYSYDLLGRMIGITDPVGITWSWTFDSLGRNTARSDPDSGNWSFEHDDAGRLEHQTDAKGQHTYFTYDQAGRLLTKANLVETTTLGYSEPRAGYFNIGRMSSVSVPGRTLTMDYDEAGRSVKQTRGLDGNTYVAERRYDSAGRLRGITYPDGDTVGSPVSPLLYDEAGRLYSIPGILSQIQYDGAGRPTAQTAANLAATTTTKTYSSRGFLTDISTGPGGTIQNLHYQPDAAGLVDYVSSPLVNEGWDYTYDELHRLTVAQSLSAPSQDQTFQYDSIGRITSNSQLLPPTYTYPPPSGPHPHGPATVAGRNYNYDLNGNIVSDGIRTIQWNPDNLVSQITKGSVITSFTYDGLGERLKKVTVGGSTSLYPMGDDYEVTNGTVTKYVSAASLGVIAKKVGADTFWLHTDRLGSIQAVTDMAGTVVQRRSYRPYGEKIVDTSSHVESRGYIDQREDAETELTYLHARYYDPALGIFISPDPIGPAGGLNQYGYGFANPVNRSDRSGLAPSVCGHPGQEAGDCSGGGWAPNFMPGWFDSGSGNSALDALNDLKRRMNTTTSTTTISYPDGSSLTITRDGDGTVTTTTTTTAGDRSTFTEQTGGCGQGPGPARCSTSVTLDVKLDVGADVEGTAESGCFACRSDIPGIAKIPVYLALDSPLAKGEKIIIIGAGNILAQVVGATAVEVVILPLRLTDPELIGNEDIRERSTWWAVQRGFNDVWDRFVFPP